MTAPRLDVHNAREITAQVIEYAGFHTTVFTVLDENGTPLMFTTVFSQKKIPVTFLPTKSASSAP